MSKINKTILQRQKEENRNYKKYMNYALDVFRWENLPEGLESRYIERTLYEHGECFFYKHKALGFVCLPVFDTNQMNIYGEYDTGQVMSMNGLINETVNYKKDGVHIWNNDLREPTQGYIKDYSQKMTQTELAIKMNIHQQKFPYFIACTKKDELTMKNMWQKISLGEPAIFHSELINLDKIEVMPTQAPYVADKLNEYRFELEREILTFLGINNNFEKKERLVVDEVNSNNEFIYRNVEIQLKHREDACKRINEMFGLNIKVVRVNEIVEEDIISRQLKFNPEDKEGESDVL